MHVYKQKAAKADRGHFYRYDRDRFISQAEKYAELIDELERNHNRNCCKILLIKIYLC